MPDAPTIRARWRDGAFHPIGARNDPGLDEGAVVALDISHPRSDVSHKHEFASIREAWLNIPEKLQDRTWAKSSDTLRKHALIATGYCDVMTIEMGAKSRAEKYRPQMWALAAAAHGYAVAVVRGSCVVIYTPHSQSYQAMPGGEFQRSKTAVLEWIADKIGASVADLERNAQ